MRVLPYAVSFVEWLLRPVADNSGTEELPHLSGVFSERWVGPVVTVQVLLLVLSFGTFITGTYVFFSRVAPLFGQEDRPNWLEELNRDCPATDRKTIFRRLPH